MYFKFAILTYYDVEKDAEETNEDWEVRKNADVAHLANSSEHCEGDEEQHGQEYD